MTDQQPPKKKPTQLALAGAGIAILAGVLAVFVASNRKQDPAPQQLAAPAVPAPAPSVVQSPQPAPPPEPPKEGRPPGPPKPPVPLPIEKPPGRYSFAFHDTSLKFVITLPDGPAKDTVLTRLRKDADKLLRETRDHARELYHDPDYNHDPDNFRTLDSSVTWVYTAKGSGLVSFVGKTSEWEGQAHPNWSLDTFIARMNGTPVSFKDMLATKDPPALGVTLCQAARIEKKKLDIDYEPSWCTSAEKAEELAAIGAYALATSEVPGKFGGVFVYFGPYSLGSYAEGTYQFAVQQEVFAKDLKPEFRKLFAGAVSAPPPLPY